MWWEFQLPFCVKSCSRQKSKEAGWISQKNSVFIFLRVLCTRACVCRVFKIRYVGKYISMAFT